MKKELNKLHQFFRQRRRKMEKDLTIRKLQECIKNIDHKNNMNDKYMLKLMEEVGELAEAVRKNKKCRMTKT